MLPTRGIRQRAIARRAHDGHHGSQPSALGELLLELWAFGELSATRVQKISAAAIQDHSDSPELLHHLAKCGASGRQPSNIHRSLCTFIKRRAPEVPQPLDFHLPMVFKRFKKGPTVGVNGAMHSMEPPFHWFAFLYGQSQIDFRNRFLGGRGGNIGDVLENFWNGIPDSDPRNIHLRQTSEGEQISSTTEIAFAELSLWCYIEMLCHLHR